MNGCVLSLLARQAGLWTWPDMQRVCARRFFPCCLPAYLLAFPDALAQQLKAPIKVLCCAALRCAVLLLRCAA